MGKIQQSPLDFGPTGAVELAGGTHKKSHGAARFGGQLKAAKPSFPNRSQATPDSSDGWATEGLVDRPVQLILSFLIRSQLSRVGVRTQDDQVATLDAECNRRRWIELPLGVDDDEGPAVFAGFRSRFQR